MTTSRRRFLAAAAALPAAPSVLARTAATDWDETFDVVVVGSGVAGTVAAIAAAEKGAKVLMIEKLNRTGGTSRFSGLNFACVGSPEQKKRGVKDSPEALARDMFRVSGGVGNYELALVMAKNTARVEKFFTDRGVRWDGRLLKLGGHSAERCLIPEGDGAGLLAALTKYMAGLKNLTVRTSCKADEVLFDKDRAAGLLVLAKGVAGQQINYTKIVLGDGYLEEGQTPRSLTGVVSPKATIDITKCVVNGDGTVTVGGVFTNDQTNDGFYYRELGLYADDPDEDVGEVLYCYGNCGDLAEWIPPTGGATIVEKTIDIVTAIGTATNVTAYIPADAYATKEDYENYKAIALAAQATANQAILLAQQAVGIAEQAAAAVVDLSNVVQQNTSKITTLWDAVFGDITTNPFQITFANLDGITLTSGVWNATLQRLEC